MFAPAVPLLFLLLGGSPLAASAVPAPGTPRAHLSGFVSDASGAGVPNAAITLETQDGQNVAATVSDATGHYRLEFTVRAGVHYSERVIAKGFHTSVQQDVPLLEGVDRVNDIHLSIGSASETVTVTPTESKGNGELGTVAQAGILGTLSLDEMPYSATSYTSQIVLDQQAQTVSDVLRNEVGIQEGNGRYSENQYLTLRGFTLEVGQALYNGIPGLVDARSPSIENIDRFEIFKGPSSFLNGASPYGAPGGTVNMVTKRAGEQPYYRFDGGYSSNSEKEGHIDLGRRFFANNALGVRVTLGGRAGNTPIDNQAENVADGAIGLDYRGKKWHGSFDLSDEARSMLGSRDAIYFDYVTGNVPQAPKLTNNIFDHSSTYTHHQLSLLAKGDYSLTDNVQIFGAYGYAHGIESYTGPGLSYLENEQGDATVYNLPDTSDMHTSVGRVGAHITAKTGPVRNEITVNGDYLQILAGYFYEYGDSYSTNIYHPIALTPLVPKVAGLKNIPNTNLNRLSSVAIADVATAFNGKLIVIGGVRGQWVGEKEYFSEIDRGSNNTPVGVACTENCSYNKGVASPSIAAMYHLPKGFSVYGNFMQDLQQGPTAPDGSANQSQVFAPYVAKQEEVGAKYEHGSLLATAALFQITEPNGVLNPTTNLYAVNGDQRNRGLELEVSGNIVPSIRVNGGISFIDARQRNTGVTFENDSNDTGGTDGKRAQGIPGTQSNLNVEWTVPKLRSLNLDARVVASNGQWGDTAEQLRIPAWARLDIGGRYQIKTKYPIDLRVNIDNVTGNNYYESGLLGLSLGAPRALRISSGIHF